MIRLSLAVLLLATSSYLTYQEYAGRVEARLWPCLELSIIDPRFERTLDAAGKPEVTLYFRQWRNKLDSSCTLLEQSHHWLFNGTSEPTAVYVKETGLPFQPRTSLVDGIRVSVELRTKMPDVAYNYKRVFFEAVVYMDRNGRKMPYVAKLEVPIPQRVARFDEPLEMADF